MLYEEYAISNRTGIIRFPRAAQPKAYAVPSIIGW